jgi:aminopeptidase N
LKEIVGNGSFLNNFDIAPWLGIDRSIALTDRAKRRKYGLPPDVRPPKLEDAAASGYHYLRHDSDWVNAEITLTTDAEQTPVAPGYTVSDTVKDGRRTLRTRTESPIMHFFSLQSARYAERHERWKSARGDEVALAVYYHPAHHSNVQRMLDAMKLSLFAVPVSASAHPRVPGVRRLRAVVRQHRALLRVDRLHPEPPR